MSRFCSRIFQAKRWRAKKKTTKPKTLKVSGEAGSQFVFDRIRTIIERRPMVVGAKASRAGISYLQIRCFLTRLRLLSAVPSVGLFAQESRSGNSAKQQGQAFQALPRCCRTDTTPPLRRLTRQDCVLVVLRSADFRVVQRGDGKASNLRGLLCFRACKREIETVTARRYWDRTGEPPQRGGCSLRRG